MTLFWATGLSHVIELGRDGETEGGKGERGSEKKKGGGGNCKYGKYGKNYNKYIEKTKNLLIYLCKV